VFIKEEPICSKKKAFSCVLSSLRFTRKNSMVSTCVKDSCIQGKELFEATISLNNTGLSDFREDLVIIIETKTKLVVEGIFIVD